jgi:GalNAc5-diNAcBac-PP-undecaprenol beta-1,3-glucosyltransferase
MTPDVSVVVPTYQRPEKLARALASIAAACSAVHEVIVVDDCPEGSGFALARQFNARYLFKAGAQRGLSQSRNLGLSLATGRYIAFLDDDDFFSPSGVDQLLAAASGIKAFVFGDFSNLFATEKVRTDLSLLTHDHLLICNQIPVGAYLMDRALVRRNFDTQMRSHEDWDFLLSNMDWARTAHVPQEVVTIDKTENHDTSMQARRSQHFWLDFMSIYGRYPAPHLKTHRRNVLLSLGIAIDEKMLALADTI